MKKIVSGILIPFLILITAIQLHADDTSLFAVQVSPDALITIDLSSSMYFTTYGEFMYVPDGTSCLPADPKKEPNKYCQTNPCSKNCPADTPFYASPGSGHSRVVKISPADTVHSARFSDASCSGPFYKTPRGIYTTDCTRIATAKKAIYDLLDDNNDGVFPDGTKINSADESSLGIRLGLMRFLDCDNLGDTGDNFSADCNKIVNEIQDGNYNAIWSTVNGFDPEGSTPLVRSLKEVKLYLDDHRSKDASKDCRQKFVIYITDGEDNVECYKDSKGKEVYYASNWLHGIQYKRMREVVAKAKAIGDSVAFGDTKYRVFVVGFGRDMPYYLRNTLNWAAYFGGTDNPLVDNSGNTSAYSPSSVARCQTEPVSNVACYTYESLITRDPLQYVKCVPHSPNGPVPPAPEDEKCYCMAKSNDPGQIDLSGYAFIAEDASQLGAALKSIINNIRTSTTYTFTAPTVPTVRMVDEEVGYISYLTPNETPFWKGNLVAYKLNPDGTFPNSLIKKWDAGEKLGARSADSRNIFTYRRNEFVSFIHSNPDNIKKGDLGVQTGDESIQIVDYVRGIDSYDIDNDNNKTEERLWKSGDQYTPWKLGDIFHSNPVIVGAPSKFFVDSGFSGPGGFYETRKNRKKLILVGGNDGMLHAFDAGDGSEKWAFIPNSVLKNLQFMPTEHRYYIDGTPKVADVWIDNGDGIKKGSEWRTVLVSGLRKGGKHYFALDITVTDSDPIYLWEFPKTDAVLNEMGQSWSEPAIGRVKIKEGGKLVEKWVAFIGGGFDPSNSTGKAFYIIDIDTGGDKFSHKFSGLDGMNYALAAPPTAVDTDFDGFVDRVYIGDLNGQMWVFDLQFSEGTQESQSLWQGKRLFAPTAPEKHPVYYQPAVAFDKDRTPWVFFGTGDRENPTDQNSKERFYAIKDDGLGTYPRSEGTGSNDVKDVTGNNTLTPVSDSKGWFIKLDSAEKALAKPSVFNQLVYFTTYIETGSSCSVEGDARLYIVEYLSGGGALDFEGLTALAASPSSSRWKKIGTGIPSAPMITINLKGQASVNISTSGNNIYSQKAFSPTGGKQLLYWRKVTP